MTRFEYGVIDEDELVYSPVDLSRDEAIRLACTLGDGHTAVRRTCQSWEPFNTGVVDPCLGYALSTPP
jgi:hypothetical protein